MAAYLTWQSIPLPRSLAALAWRAQQPQVPPPRPGTYGNAAVARIMAGGARQHSSSSSTRKTATITILAPRSHATAATRATNVRAPPGVNAPQSPTASTFSSPSTSGPHATVISPHRPQATDATRTTGVSAPPRAGTPQSCRQERASKRAARRHRPQHHAATAIQEHRASPAGRGAVCSPQNTAAVGTRPEKLLGTAHPQMSPAPGPTRDPAPQPQTPHNASPCGRQAAAKKARPEPGAHHCTPILPTEGPRGARTKGPPTQTRTATLTDSTNARPLSTVRPHAHNPAESPSPQDPATPSASAPRCHLPSPAQAKPHPHGTTTHQPGRQYGPQKRHLAVARPPTRARTQTRTRRAPPSRLTPRGPPIRKARQGRRTCRKATAERKHNRRAPQPPRPHRPPSHKAGSPRWTPRRK